MERYLRVNLLGPGPRLIKKKEFTGPRSHKGSETLLYCTSGMTQRVITNKTRYWRVGSTKETPTCLSQAICWTMQLVRFHLVPGIFTQKRFQLDIQNGRN